jgi:hypothetical protein
MKLTHVFAAISLVIGATSSQMVFSQTETVSTQHQSTTTVFSGSPGYLEVRRFIAQHTRLGNDNAPPSFSVTVTHSVSDTSVQTDDVPGPPVPLPETGNSGDTITISSCGGGMQQSWTFVYDTNASSGANGWVLESYSVKVHVKACTTGN